MNFIKMNGMSVDGRIFINDKMGTLEALIPPGGYETAHAPAMLELPNGDLLCAWFAGSFEGSPDISIVCSRLPAGSDKWESPVKVSNDPSRSEQNPSFFLKNEGEIWLVYTSQLARAEGHDNMQFTSVIRYQKSFDGGITWTESEILFGEEGSFCRQPIQVLSNGRWIFSNWSCSPDVNDLSGDPTIFRLSDDQGVSWRTVQMSESNGRVHANIIELDTGHLISLMRSRFADFIYRSESNDYGDTWSIPQPTILPNNNSSISALKLESGRIAVAYNPTRAPEAEFGVSSWPGLRCPVAVALSEDGGTTWPLIRNMEPGEGFSGPENSTNNSQYEYPYMMQGRDGMIHLAFAYCNRLGVKYMRFDEAAVSGKKREAVGLYNPTSAKTS